MKFEDLVVKEFYFYGVDNNSFKIGVHIFEAEEDEDDGYRSFLRSVEVKDPAGLIFFGTPIATVRVADLDEISSDRYETRPLHDGYQLIDVDDGHVWLRFGTDVSDDYYPCFIFDYMPKPPA